MITFADLIKLLEAFNPDDKVFGVIGIGNANLDLAIRYSSGTQLPDWDEWLTTWDEWLTTVDIRKVNT
jgi:hypothetical protein